MEIKEINDRILNIDYKQINLVDRPLDMVVLPHKKVIIATNYIEKGFSFLDENFKLIKTVNKIEDEMVEPYGIALNNDVGIFVSDHFKHRIILTDFEMNLIQSFGSRGSSSINQFDCPCGISFKNKRLYVSDYNNKRIQVINSDLSHIIETLTLDYSPWLVIATDRTLAVSRCDPSAYIYFYDLTNKFILRHKYQKGECRISEINSCFYAFSFNSKKIYSFDSYGCLIAEITIDRFSQFISNMADGSLVLFNNYLVLTFYKMSVLIIFTFS